MRLFYEKNYFLIKRLHSLTGIVPIGAFFLVHMLLNSRAFQGRAQYQWVPDTLDQVPFLWVIEVFVILLPIVFHALLGAWIVWEGDLMPPKPAMAWYSNIAYLLQRITGVLLFVMLFWHIATTWWVHERIKLSGQGEFDIFATMAQIVAHPVWLILYALFVLTAAYHFGNGIYNFTYKWGVTTNKRAQKWSIAFGLLVGFAGTWLGFASLYGLMLNK